MYTAKITRANSVSGIINLSVDYLKDGELFFSIDYRVSEPESIKDLIKRQIAQYKKIDSIDISSLLGDVDLSEPEPIVEDPELQAFEIKKQKLIDLKQEVDLGLTSQADYDVVLNEATELKIAKV